MDSSKLLNDLIKELKTIPYFENDARLNIEKIFSDKTIARITIQWFDHNKKLHAGHRKTIEDSLRKDTKNHLLCNKNRNTISFYHRSQRPGTYYLIGIYFAFPRFCEKSKHSSNSEKDLDYHLLYGDVEEGELINTVVLFEIETVSREQYLRRTREAPSGVKAIPNYLEDFFGKIGNLIFGEKKNE